MARGMKFSNGQSGAALPVRVIPRATKDEIIEILSDQTVKVRLTTTADDAETNQELIRFLAEVLDLPQENFEIVAGINGRDKLVSILDITTEEVQDRILQNLA